MLDTAFLCLLKPDQCFYFISLMRSTWGVYKKVSEIKLAVPFMLCKLGTHKPNNSNYRLLITDVQLLCLWNNHLASIHNYNIFIVNKSVVKFKDTWQQFSEAY